MFSAVPRDALSTSDSAPTTIHVKRKRNAEPVDSLYVETERRGSKRHVTEQAILFRRRQEGQDEPTVPSLSEEPQRVHSAQFVPGVPVVRATLPGEEDSEKRRRKGVATPNNASDSLAPIKSSPLVESDTSEASTYARDRPVPRRFHISKAASATLEDRTSVSGIRKRRNGYSQGLVFVETKRAVNHRGNRSTAAAPEPVVVDEAQASMTAINKPLISKPLSPQRKRPGAGAAEKRWREKNWKTREADRAVPKETAETASPQLLAHMQKFAEEVETNEQHSSGVAESQQKLATKLKYKPKAPARYKDRHPEVAIVSDDVDEMDIDSVDDGDYVYDTYVRHTELIAMSGTENLLGNVGYLVITEEDQEIWDAYAEDVESDKDWNSEEEDENAEDYYGADYPEDEVASDDEYGLGTYKYRHGASDEEEFDSDTGAFSDDEHDLQTPWKRHPWAQSKQANDENA